MPPTPTNASAGTRGLQEASGRPARPSVILADDHAIVAAGVRSLLEPACRVLAVVADGEALVKAARELRPDLVIADISMPLCNGIDAIRRIRRERPQLLAICLTMHADRMYLSEALEAGASGFVVKHAAAEELRQAIAAVLRGKTYVSPQLGGHERQGRAAPPAPDRSGGPRLSQRQRQVLQLVAEGRTMRQIAAILQLTPKTVEFHKYRAMHLLGLRTSAELVQFAVRHGLVAAPVELRSR